MTQPLTIQIDVRKLCAVSQAARPKPDVSRPYLSNVLIETGPSGTIYIATNGHMLLAARDMEATAEAPCAFTIPASAALRISKLTTKYTPHVCCEVDLAGARAAFRGKGEEIVPIEQGGFPEWRKILRAHKKGPAQFDPALLARFQAASKHAGVGNNRVVTLRHAGDAGALVDIGHPDYIGVLMPVKGRSPDGGHISVPDWVAPGRSPC